MTPPQSSDLPPKPLPKPDFDTEPYWAGLREHTLRLQRCQSCGKAYFFPRILCPHCWSDDVRWEPMSGRGRVYTYTVVHRAPMAAFRDDVPYIVAVVQLEEGPRIPGRLVECDPSAAAVDMPVEVVFDDVNETITMASFRPVKS